MSLISSPKMYQVRCSPDCPYEDCVILTNIPPHKQQEGGGEGNAAQQDKDSDNNSSSNSRPDSDNQDNKTQDKAQSPQEGSGKSPAQPPKDDGGHNGDDGESTKPPEKPEQSEQQANNEPSGGSTPERPKPKPTPQKDPGSDESTQEKPKPEPKPEPEIEYKPVFDPKAPLPMPTGASREIKEVKPRLGKLELITDQVFQARLKNVLVDNAYDRRVRGRKRGRLDMKSLYKTAVKAENIFTLKEARKNKNYNVILIVDQSGSMQDYNSNRLNIAIDCAVFLARALGRVNINYAVIGFGGNWEYYKKFSQVATDDFLKKMGYSMKVNRGGTSLIPPLKEAYKELKKTPEAQNIVITLTDGTPENAEGTLHIIHGNRHVAETVDIGIANKPLMTNGILVNNVNELKPAIIKELRKRVKRG